MKLIFVISLLTSLSAFGSDLKLKFECFGPDLNYINEFEVSSTIYLEDTDKPNNYMASNISLAAKIKNSGYSSETMDQDVLDMKAGVKFVNDPSWTREPFWIIQLTPMDRASNPVAFMNLAINYPGPLSSTMRMKNGRVYKSHCKLIED